MGDSRSLEVGGREVVVSNPDKVIFPEPGVTKLDLVNYYLAVADGALRGVARRPMILKRFVKGIAQEAIFQKRAPEKRPDWIDVAELKYASGTSAKEAVIDEAAGLVWAVSLGCIDFNPHPVRADDLEHPDELRVDLDPMPGVEWPQIVDVAIVVRDVLTDPNDAAIACTIVTLAQSLGLDVVAEGVETEGQREFLLRNGCHKFQGYLFGRPVPADQL